MADELSCLLAESAGRHQREAEASADAASVAVAIVGASRRRRRARAAVSALASVGVAAVIGGGAYVGVTAAWTGTSEPGVAIALSQAPEPTPSSTVPPTPTPSAATPRGDGFPDASPLDAAAWDAVGEGWSVRVMGVAAADASGATPEAVLYLVSSDERWYEIAALGEDASLDARVASWREREQTVTVTWRDAGGSPHAGEVSLPGGDLSEIAFAMPGGETSASVAAVAIDDQGVELWRAVAPDGAVRYYRWSADRGWTVAALSTEVLITGPGAFAEPSDAGAGAAVRFDGAAVALDRSSAGDGVVDEVAFYDLDADVVWVQQTGMVKPHCTFEGWSRLGSQVQYACSDAEAGAVVEMPAAPPLGGFGSLATNQHPDTDVAVRAVVPWGGRLAPEQLAGS